MTERYPWVIEEDLEIVHRSWCSVTHGGSLTPYGSLAKTNEEMVEHLARPDVANNHQAPSTLFPCDQCVRGLSLEDV